MSEVMLGFNHLGPHGYHQYGQCHDDGTDHNYFYDGNDSDDNVMIIATGQKVIVDMIIWYSTSRWNNHGAIQSKKQD